jgi:hypothetical protein
MYDPARMRPYFQPLQMEIAFDGQYANRAGNRIANPADFLHHLRGQIRAQR